MSTDLERFRDHCRRMADDSDSHDTAVLGTDRDLWQMLADEADAYLARTDEDQPLDLEGS